MLKTADSQLGIFACRQVAPKAFKGIYILRLTEHIKDDGVDYSGLRGKKMPDYDLEFDRILAEIQKKKAKFIGLQFPEGLKKDAVRIAERIESRSGAKTVIFIDPCYGACDTKGREGEMLGLDLIIHFGHTRFRKVH